MWSGFWNGTKIGSEEEEEKKKQKEPEKKQEKPDTSIQVIKVDSNSNMSVISLETHTPIHVYNEVQKNLNYSGGVYVPQQLKCGLIAFCDTKQSNYSERNEIVSALLKRDVFGDSIICGPTDCFGNYGTLTQEELNNVINKENIIDLAPEFIVKEKKKKKRKEVTFQKSPKSVRKSKRIAKRIKNGKYSRK